MNGFFEEIEKREKESGRKSRTNSFAVRQKEIVYFLLQNTLLSGISDGSTAIQRSYTYDALGRNNQEINNTNTVTLFYDPSGMVTQVNKNGNQLQANAYSDGGDRFQQTVYDGSGSPMRATYYVHDASSNVIAVYEKDLTTTTTGILLSELSIVGLGRIGNIAVSYDATGNPQYGYYYELSDHLGNVRLVFDRTATVSSGFPVVHYYSDYYSFGLPIADRSSQGYRNAYQGQWAEYDQATTGWYSFYWRPYDPQTGRWKIPDPFGQHYSPYISMSNSPHINIDPSGGYDFGFGEGAGLGQIGDMTKFSLAVHDLPEVSILSSGGGVELEAADIAKFSNQLIGASGLDVIKFISNVAKTYPKAYVTGSTLSQNLKNITSDAKSSLSKIDRIEFSDNKITINSAKEIKITVIKDVLNVKIKPGATLDINSLTNNQAIIDIEGVSIGPANLNKLTINPSNVQLKIGFFTTTFDLK